MNPYSIPPLTTALLALFLCFLVISRNPKSIVNATFGGLCLLTAGWQGTWTILFSTRDPQLVSLLIKIGYSWIILIPIVFFHFINAFTNHSEDRIVGYSYALGIAFLIALWTSGLFIAGPDRVFWGFYPRAGILHPLYLIALTLMLARGLYLLFRYKRQIASQPIKVNQTNYLIGSTIIYSLSASDFLVNYGIEFYPIGFLFTTAYTAIITYAIIQYRLLEISLVFKKSLIYTCLLFALLIPCYVLVILGQIVAFGSISYLFSLFILVLFVIVGFIFPKLRFRTEEGLERVLFKKRFDYRHTLLRSSRDMISVVDLDSLSKGIVNTVSKALGTDKACLFLFDELKGAFGIKTCVGLDVGPLRETLLTKDDPLVQRLTQKSDIVVREEIEVSQNGQGWEHPVAARMAQLEAEVSLPLMSQEGLIGILNLGYRAGKAMYSDEDFEVLSTLANQAAIAIENARLYDNLKQSQSIIMRADRLSSLGMLTAGLAHEIRNPLVAIRTFTQLLPERYTDPEFRESFQSLALKEVDRICGLVNDLLSFARPSVPNVAAENVNEIVENIVRILETQAKAKGIQIYRGLATGLPKIFIDKEQIKQVSMNIILNALQSIEGEGVVEVSTRLFTKSGSEQFVQIEVRDTGGGIPEKDLDNIFNPFFTSKEGGSGLGLSISHQIVQEHGGYIVVESQVDAGTTFYINLPVKEPDLRGKSPIIHEKDLGG